DRLRLRPTARATPLVRRLPRGLSRPPGRLSRTTSWPRLTRARRQGNAPTLPVPQPDRTRGSRGPEKRRTFVSIEPHDPVPGVPPVGRPGDPLSLERAFEPLERFGQDLQQCEQASRQLPLVLAAIQKGIGADVVYWHPGATSDPPEQVGALRLAPEWCQA